MDQEEKIVEETVKTEEKATKKKSNKKQEEIEKALAEAGVDEKARGETLSPQRLANLSDVLLDMGVMKL